MNLPASRSDRGISLDDIRTYWDGAHDVYLTHVGTTFQAGRITVGRSMRESNLWLARAAGLKPGQLVLDAGCGVCGPSIDMAREIPGLRIVGITLSRRQTTTAGALIREAHLADRVQVVCGDYHVLPFNDHVFDSVFFLESVGYAGSLECLFSSIHRVLKPGACFYIKDVFRRELLLSDQEQVEWTEFDRAYAQHTPTLSECVSAAASVGFTSIMTRDLSDLVSTGDARRAMFEAGNGRTPSAFGRLHYRRYSCLPVYFADMTGRVAGPIT